MGCTKTNKQTNKQKKDKEDCKMNLTNNAQQNFESDPADKNSNDLDSAKEKLELF